MRRKILFSSFRFERNFLYFITYFSALSISGIDVGSILDILSKRFSIYTSISNALKRLIALHREWGFTFAQACSNIASKVSSRKLRGFLVKLAYSLEAGEELCDFAQREFRLRLAECSTEFERSIESMRKLMDAYTSLFSSLVMLVTALSLGTLVLWGSAGILWLECVSVFGALVLLSVGVVLGLLLKTPPILHDNITEPQVRYFLEISSLVSTSIIPLVVLSDFFINWSKLLGILDPYASPTLVLSIGSVPALILGVVGCRYVAKVYELSTYTPTLLKALCLAYDQGLSHEKAVASALTQELGPLKHLLTKLHKRLVLSSRTDIAWASCLLESGSEILRRYITILLDAVEVGSDPIKVNELLTEACVFELSAIQKRRQMARHFLGLLLPLSCVLSIYCGLIHGVLSHLFPQLLGASKVLAVPGPSGTGELGSVLFLQSLTITVLNIINALTLSLVEGFNYMTLAKNIGLLLVITGPLYSGSSFIIENLLRGVILLP